MHRAFSAVTSRPLTSAGIGHEQRRIRLGEIDRRPRPEDFFALSRLCGIDHALETGERTEFVPADHYFPADFTPKLTCFRDCLTGKSALVDRQAFGARKVSDGYAGHTEEVNGV